MYTLLIADDEADERKLVQFLLREWTSEFRILEASNGKEALNILASEPVDILLSDIQMPFLSGIELAREARKICPDLEILFFSGYDDFEYVQNALSLRAVNYILKPLEPSEFHRSLTDILERLNKRTIQFANTEQYIESNFHKAETAPLPGPKNAETAPLPGPKNKEETTPPRRTQSFCSRSNSQLT